MFSIAMIAAASQPAPYTCPPWVPLKYRRAPLYVDCKRLASDGTYGVAVVRGIERPFNQIAKRTGTGGYAQDASGVWVPFTGTALRATNNGLLSEANRTQRFKQTNAPATQTVTVVNASQFTVWMEGTGSITLSGALTGTVTAAAPFVGTTASASLTLTLSGSVTFAQVENGGFKTSRIDNTGTGTVVRPNDGITTLGGGVTLHGSGRLRADVSMSDIAWKATTDRGRSSLLAMVPGSFA